MTTVPALILAFSALVLVPLALSSRAFVVAALPLVASMLLSPGWPAGLLAVPYLVLCAAVALAGLLRLLRRGFAAPEQLALDAGLIFLVIGAAWTMAWRAGIEPLGYAPMWCLLTAVHFHVAGFALPVVAANLARGFVRPDASLPVWVNIALAGIVAGIPLTAVGFAWSQPLELFAALALSVAAMMVACMSMLIARTGAARALSVISGLSLLIAMPLAANYALGGAQLRLGSLTELETMALTHGVLNAVGFAGAGLLAAYLAPLAERGIPPLSNLASRGRVDADLFARMNLERTDLLAHGLVDQLEQLDHAGFEAKHVAAPIRAFYEHTDAHHLRVVPNWQPGFRLGGRLWAAIAQRLGQLQLPVRAEHGGEGIESRIVALADDADGRPGTRAWLRSYADGRAMYVAAYAVHERDGVGYMNIAFPLPRANLTSILRMDPLADGAIVLTTRGGDAGIWLVANAGVRALPIPLPMSEAVRVWTPDMTGAPADLVALATGATTCIARHELRLCGLHYLTLDYVIEPR